MAVFEDETRPGTISDDEIKALTNEAQDAQRDYNRRKQDKIKEIVATKKKLFDRGERLYDIKIAVDEEEDGTQVMMKFKARRLTHSERAKFEPVKPYDGYTPVSDEQFVKIKNQGYEVLEAVIVDPKMSKEEWEKVDVAVTEELIAKVSLLQYQTNDTALVHELANLSEM